MAFRLVTPRTFTRAFHRTPTPAIRAGDVLPRLALFENSPGNKVNLAEEIAGKRAVVVGVPAAFSPTCSAQHVPGYMKHKAVKGGEVGVWVVSVNDAFVMKAWADQLDPAKESGVRFLADPTGEFTKALDLEFDATAILGGPRSKRYALVVNSDGVVERVHVEADNIGTSVSLAENVLG